MLRLSIAIIGFSYNRVLTLLILLEFALIGVFFSLSLWSFITRPLIGIVYLAIIATEAAIGLSVLVFSRRARSRRKEKRGKCIT